MVKNVTLREAWSGQADCLNCSLRATVLFAGLEEKDFERIHDPIDQFVIKPGTTLYHAGDSGDYMFTVRSGAFKLVQYLPDGGQRIVRLARTTDVIGPRPCSTITTSMTRSPCIPPRSAAFRRGWCAP